jgi:hypothetical protein
MRKGRVSHKFIFVLCTAVVVALLLPAMALAAPVLADSYAESNADGEAWYASPSLAGQSFTAIAGTVDSAKLSLWRTGNPTGQIRAYIYALSGVYGTDSVPTGAPLATSAPVDAAALGTTAGLVTFSFNNTVSLTAGQKYFLVVDFPVGTMPTDFSILGYNGIGTGHPGNASENLDGTAWTGYDFADFVFYVYETPPAPPVVSTPSSSTWSLSLLALGGFGVAFVTRKRVAA